MAFLRPELIAQQEKHFFSSPKRFLCKQDRENSWFPFFIPNCHSCRDICLNDLLSFFCGRSNSILIRFVNTARFFGLTRRIRSEKSYINLKSSQIYHILTIFSSPFRLKSCFIVNINAFRDITELSSSRSHSRVAKVLNDFFSHFQVHENKKATKKCQNHNNKSSLFFVAKVFVWKSQLNRF